MKILLVVDMQNDFVTGSLGTKEAQAIVPKIVDKINKGSYDKVWFTKDTHHDDYLKTQEGKKLPIKHCIKGTEGHKIIPELLFCFPSASTFEKETFGSIEVGGQLKYMTCPHQQSELSTSDLEIELIGVCTDICVISNALLLKAAFPEAKISVDASCCAGTTPENHQKALDVMKSCQIEVINK